MRTILDTWGSPVFESKAESLRKIRGSRAVASRPELPTESERIKWVSKNMDDGLRHPWNPVKTSPQQARTLYDIAATMYDIVYHCHIPDIPQIIYEVNLKQSDVVLDLGTGLGWVARCAAMKCKLAIGLDISLNMVDKATAQVTAQSIDNVRFGVADMLDLQSINNATSYLVYILETLEDLIHAGYLIPPPSYPHFNLVFLRAAFSHVDPAQQPAFLQMVHDNLLQDGGRLVICHENSQGETYTLEEQYEYKPVYYNRIMSTWGKRRVGNRATEDSTTNEIVQLATGVCPPQRSRSCDRGLQSLW